ncbi:hypothetical protein [Bacillus wiedmannii]
MQVVANQDLIEKVIVNYITNAIRYTPAKKDVIISTINKQKLKWRNKYFICYSKIEYRIQKPQSTMIWGF